MALAKAAEELGANPKLAQVAVASLALLLARSSRAAFASGCRGRLQHCGTRTSATTTLVQDWQQELQDAALDPSLLAHHSGHNENSMRMQYSFGYRYAFHKVRSSGLPGLPVSRSLF